MFGRLCSLTRSAQPECRERKCERQNPVSASSRKWTCALTMSANATAFGLVSATDEYWAKDKDRRNMRLSTFRPAIKLCLNERCRDLFISVKNF